MTPLRKRTVTMMVSTVAAVAVWPAANRASFSNDYEPDLRRCFCGRLDGNDIVSIVMGRLIEGRPTPEGVDFHLLVEGSYGASAPAVGEEVPLRWATLTLEGPSGPGSLLLLEDEDKPDERRVLWVEEGQTLRFLGSPSSHLGFDYFFDEHCVERRDADAVLSFIESVDFDYLRCLDEVPDALDIPRPSYLERGESGCSGGGSEALTGMALALGLLAGVRRGSHAARSPRS